jgi:hypothetical protein
MEYLVFCTYKQQRKEHKDDMCEYQVVFLITNDRICLFTSFCSVSLSLPGCFWLVFTHCPLFHLTNRSVPYDRCSLDARRGGGAASVRRHLGRQAFLCRYGRRIRIAPINKDGSKNLTLWDVQVVRICPNLRPFVVVSSCSALWVIRVR